MKTYLVFLFGMAAQEVIADRIKEKDDAFNFMLGDHTVASFQRSSVIGWRAS